MDNRAAIVPKHGSMMTKIKICGLSTEPTLDAAIDAGADMVGLVFHEASPRFVDLDRAEQLARRAAGRVETVALVVDADDALLDEIVAAIKPDWLQLHGRETPERVGAIVRRHAPRVIKALPVHTADDVAAVGPFETVADMILLDAKPPKNASRPGGHGVPFDWNILRQARPSRPFMLSGGLSPDNVAEAIRTTRPAAVDVSSGVETAPGEKDPDLIRAFVATVRAHSTAPMEALS